MLNKKVYLTKDGLVKMENELDQLKYIKRKEVIERIKAALGF